MRIERLARSRKAMMFGFVLALAITGLLLTARPAQAATITVDTSADDAATNGNCTLREAITAANTNAAVDACASGASGADTIGFNIPGNGPHTITPSPALPQITEQVTIDGYTQGDATADPADDAKENTLAQGGTDAVLKIELSGDSAGVASGLVIFNAQNCVIRGLAIHGFGLSGISNFGSNNRVEGNFLGTDASGTSDLGNGRGMVVSGSNNVVGGTTPETRNLISGNGFGGVSVSSDFNRVEGNLIGTDKTGTTPLGNSSNGVELDNSPDANIIGGLSPGAANTIAFNSGDGVSILSGARNLILSNSVFSNAGEGIDLGGDGPSPNDPGDADTGANNLQNFPVITSARTSRSATTIKGTLNSAPNQVFAIQFFSNPSDTDEGKTFIGQTVVTTNSSGNTSFSFKPAQKVPRGQVITATATSDDTGDTSEFSAPKKVVRKR